MWLRSTNKVILVPLLRMDSNLVLSSDVKKYQQTFFAPLPGVDSNSILGDCVKKCQQAFLAPLLEKALVKRIF